MSARDGCIVDSEPLAIVVCCFVDAWHRDRPSTGGQFAQDGRRTEVAPVGALDWLALESGVPKHVIAKIATRDRFGHPKPRTPRTELRVADALINAMERPELFHDGTLEVRPNPIATAKAQALCCSGSLNGAL